MRFVLMHNPAKVFIALRKPVRTTPYLIGLLWLLPLLTVLSASVSAQQGPRVGVFVEAVTPNAAAQRAGLREGDLLEKWERGTAHGQIESPFDLVEIAVEQAPLGTVTLEGQRGGQEQRWTLGFDDWGLQSRPILTNVLQKLYDQGRRQESSGAHLGAARQWLAAAARGQDAVVPWLAPWFLRRAADSLARAGQSRRSEQAYRKAAGQAVSSKPIVSVQLLQSWANLSKQRNDWEHAQEHYKQSLLEEQKWRSESFSIVASLAGLGTVSAQRGNVALAEEYDNRALAIAQKLAPESLPVASVLSNISGLLLRRGDLPGAEEYARRALAMREKLAPDGLDVAASFNILGRTFDARGDLAKAQEYYSRALIIRQRLASESLDAASSFNNLGNIFARRGDLLKGEEYLGRALAIEDKLAHGSLDMAGNLNNLGLISFLQGDLAKAEEYHYRALAIREARAPGSPEVGQSLGNLAEVFSQRGDLSRAEKYQRRALAIIEKVAPGSLDVALGLDTFGDISKARGDLVKATRYYRQSLAIRKKLAPESLELASSLSNLGEVFYRGGDLVKAERYYTQALTIIEKLSPGSSSDADVLVALARLYRQRRQLNAAAGLFARALDALEHQTGRLGGSTNERAAFRAEHVSYYKDYIDVLLAQNRPQLAFQVLERSRARSFLEMLAERDLVFAADLPADIQQARHENAAAYERTQAQVAEAGLKRDAAQIEKLQKQLRDLEAERASIGERARQASPHFAALHYPQPLDLEAVRTALDPGTVLLSYSVSANHTALFVVLPLGQEPGLSVFNLKATDKPLREQVEAFRKLIRRAGEANAQKSAGGNEARESRQASLTAQERELYDLLVAPAETIIAASQRLLLIPDGPLQVLPFAALKDKSGRYLVEWRPVHTAMSATVYAELKRMRPAKSDKPVELAAFGDPLYPPGAQAAATWSKGVDTSDGELRSAVERGVGLSRLPFSRLEVQSIAGLFAGHDLKYLGDQATEEHAKALGKGVRYIHFATHGLLDERFPLNSALVLTIPAKLAEGQENGFLQAWEIFEQVHLDADLVTLSACSTGLGQELNGEGLIGLTRAFQYAGARSVLASLWSVDDYRTMQLMRRFYAELHAGASKDAALRTAQLQLVHSSSNDPYFWAAFSLAGDWH